MSTRIELPCPSCGRTLKVRPEYVGRTVSCKYCDHAFVVQVSDERAPHFPSSTETRTTQEIGEEEGPSGDFWEEALGLVSEPKPPVKKAPAPVRPAPDEPR